MKLLYGLIKAVWPDSIREHIHILRNRLTTRKYIVFSTRAYGGVGAYIGVLDEKDSLESTLRADFEAEAKRLKLQVEEVVILDKHDYDKEYSGHG